jgi:hypothetical protein
MQANYFSYKIKMVKSVLAGRTCGAAALNDGTGPAAA